MKDVFFSLTFDGGKSKTIKLDTLKETKTFSKGVKGESIIKWCISKMSEAKDPMLQKLSNQINSETKKEQKEILSRARSAWYEEYYTKYNLVFKIEFDEK